MKKLYIHIGQEKTGTSAIQAFLALNRELLKERGIYYPESGKEIPVREKNSVLAGNADWLVKWDESLEQMDDLQRNEFQIGKQQAESWFEKSDTVLLSNEVLWRCGSVFYKNLQEFLNKTCDIAIKVIVYLRRQDERLESYWNQLVKSGICNCSCMEFCMGVCADEWNYDLQLTKISDVIGKENVIVRIYDTERFRNGTGILTDFMSVFGMEDLSDFRIPGFQANPSLGKDMIEIMRVMNTVPSVRLLDDELRKIRKESICFARNTEHVIKAPSFLSYSERKKLLERCEHGNKQIGEAYFGINASPFPVLEDQYSVELARGGVNTDLVYFFGNLLVEQAKQIEMLHREIDVFHLPHTVRCNSRVIVYGADQRGRRVYHWLQKENRYSVVGFVDIRWKKIREIEETVSEPEIIFSKEFDYILISVGPQDTALKIQSWLERNHIAAEKIIRI